MAIVSLHSNKDPNEDTFYFRKGKEEALQHALGEMVSVIPPPLGNTCLLSDN